MFLRIGFVITRVWEMKKYIHLNLSNGEGDATYFNDTDPTSTYFTVNDAQQINGAGYNYVAYVFAGGPAASTSQVKLCVVRF